MCRCDWAPVGKLICCVRVHMSRRLFAAKTPASFFTQEARILKSASLVWERLFFWMQFLFLMWCVHF